VTNKKQKISPVAATFVALLALASAMGIGRFSLTPIMPLMQQDSDLSLALAGWMATANYLGYLIGALLYDSIGLWLIQLYGYGNKVEAFREAYAQWGGWIILLKGLTPIPYKIVTIASGFAGYNVFLFVLLSIVARGMRFFLLAFLLNRYGAQARLIIEKRLGFWVGAAAVLLVGGIVAALYLF